MVMMLAELVLDLASESMMDEGLHGRNQCQLVVPDLAPST
jgi:hypothetical protein